MAIMLSLCGVMVDVGLEPYLPPSLHEMILGPTSALTQTQFHNLRNQLEEGLHPKSVDLDGFSRAQRLLGWTWSLDRLQVPRAELEMWLVQREPDPLPIRCPDQASPLERAPPEAERDLTVQPLEPRAGLEDEEEDEEDTETSLQECLRLLEETFLFTEDQQLSDVGGRTEDLDLESQPSNRESFLPPIIPTDNPSMDLELHWQDLLAIMEPENTDMDMMTFDHNLDSRQSGTFRGIESGAACQHTCDNVVTEADQDARLMDTRLQPGLLEPQNHSEPALLPLTSITELGDHNSAENIQDTLNSIDAHPLNSPPDQTDLLAEDPSEDLSMGLTAEENTSPFIIDLLTQVAVARMEPENLPSIDANFQPSGFTSALEGNVMTQDLLGSPSSRGLVDEDNDDDLPIPLSDLLEDAAILNEIRLLDLALEEGFNPEMAARLEENLGQPSTHHQGNFTDGEDEPDSDSGLSLDFSHSPASPCVSEASYSSSSTSSSSAMGSPFSKDEDEDAEDGLVGSDMEVEMMIKQEELEEEELGAVGGAYPENENKLVPPNYVDHSLFHEVSQLEHIGHDHTYNQPWSSACSLPFGKMPTKHTKSAPRHQSAKPYPCSFSRPISKNKIWSRDERHAQALKIPFSNELIVNLPVEEFNDLLSNYQLNEEQLTLIRDIRRRGKNKIAAQNCRKRKQDVVLGLEDDVSTLRRHRSRLLREKQETLRNLQEMRRQLEMLYKEVFSSLVGEEGSPLDATEYMLHFKPNGRNRKKQNHRDKKETSRM